MNYADKLLRHWDIMVSDFSIEMGKSTPDTISPKKANDWYKDNIYQWNNIVEKEDLLTAQQANPKLDEHLIKSVERFEFHKVIMPQKPSLLIHFLTGVVVGVEICVLLIEVMQVASWIAVLETIISIIASFIIYAISRRKYKKNAILQICSQYVDQLTEQKETLIYICDKYKSAS